MASDLERLDLFGDPLNFQPIEVAPLLLRRRQLPTFPYDVGFGLILEWIEFYFLGQDGGWAEFEFYFLGQDAGWTGLNPARPSCLLAATVLWDFFCATLWFVYRHLSMLKLDDLFPSDHQICSSIFLGDLRLIPKSVVRAPLFLSNSLLNANREKFKAQNEEIRTDALNKFWRISFRDKANEFLVEILWNRLGGEDGINEDSDLEEFDIKLETSVWNADELWKKVAKGSCQACLTTSVRPGWESHIVSKRKVFFSHDDQDRDGIE
ncbi:hypothetical protein M9H77_21366 [Catharanthus roseus]|uniref:Uncharacterized protein n=1 Tax=Catharanthus roseus TaxID=4058 RepID=A0ACC0AQ25_CATRO|nr:hypothetical protein M9H77_21366 [Catharanthus roseus]